MRTKGCGPRNLGVPKGSPFKLDPATATKVASMAKEAKKDKDSGGEKETNMPLTTTSQKETTTTTSKPINPKNLDVNDPFEGVPYRGTPLKFKGANSSNSSCWKGYKKVGTKPSPTNPGVTVNDCKKI